MTDVARCVFVIPAQSGDSDVKRTYQPSKLVRKRRHGFRSRMATTGGEDQVYRRYGLVRFRVDDQPAQLVLYASDDSDELFIPFRDATSGKETYGAGRYLELHAHGDDVTIDFNYAYNPNCAYDPSWSCPLPPAENWLKVPIRAGEKTFGAGAGH